ncbi:MAG: PilN domain-containing protein [Opitutales bacterium]|nr:PilN domain-containing protein [Opitutales bacterium]
MHRFLSSMRQRLPSPKDPAVFFVPGDLFFTERVEIPSGLSVSESDAYVQTALEGMSPFSLDHLMWGWIRLSGTHDSAMVYAALAEKVQPRLPDGMGSGVHVFPSFLPFLEMVPDRPMVRAGVCGDSVSVLMFDRASDLPAEIHTTTAESGLGDSGASVVRQDMLRALGLRGWEIDSALYSHEMPVWERSDAMICPVCALGSEPEAFVGTGLRLEGHALWNADIRPFSQKLTLEKSSVWGRRLWKATAVILITLAALIGLEGVAVGLKARVKSQKEWIERQAPRVAAIESKFRNIEVFQQGAAASLQPLVMLDIINRMRPDEVYFTEVKARDGNTLEIQGMSEQNGVDLLNRFRSELSASSQLAEVSLDVTSITQGSARFTLVAKFNELPHPQPAEAPAVNPESVTAS